MEEKRECLSLEELDRALAGEATDSAEIYENDDLRALNREEKERFGWLDELLEMTKPREDIDYATWKKRQKEQPCEIVKRVNEAFGGFWAPEFWDEEDWDRAEEEERARGRNDIIVDFEAKRSEEN